MILVGLTMAAFTWLSGPVIRAVQGTGTHAPGAADTLRALLPRWTWAGRLLQVMLIAYVFVVEESYTVPLVLLTAAAQAAGIAVIEVMLRYARARA